MTTISAKSTPSTLAGKPGLTLRWSFAQTHPLVAFLLITFAWSWLIWFATIPLPESERPLMSLLTLAGAYGPAIGGILTLGLKNGLNLRPTGKQLAVMIGATLLIFAVLALRALTPGVPHMDGLPVNIALTAPVIAAGLLTCLVGGWVISNARSANSEVRARMGSILPTRLPLFWSLVALLFFPLMLLLSWAMGELLGMGVEYPPVWELPAAQVLGLFAMSLVFTALMGGGLEEPGWRGAMQPILQRKYNPLVASLIVSLAWSLWHLPLYLNGFYPGDLLTGMLGSGIYRILLAIFLTWYYNRSGGSLFWLVYLHTCFNMMVSFLPVSDFGMLILWLLVVGVIIVKDKMYRKQ